MGKRHIQRDKDCRVACSVQPYTPGVHMESFGHAEKEKGSEKTALIGDGGVGIRGNRAKTDLARDEANQEGQSQELG